MIDKYFGFKTINNEVSVIDSLIEHSRIDEEELFLLREMLYSFCEQKYESLQEQHCKILKIRADSNRIFEYTEEEIIQAHFDFQKQYDLLRIYQRIETISSSIATASDRIIILYNIEGIIPQECHYFLQHLIELIKKNHEQFKSALIEYEKNKANVINIIHKVIELEKNTDDHYFRCIESLYKLANENQLKLGHFRALEKLFESLEFIGNEIENASTSLEWLLIN